MKRLNPVSSSNRLCLYAAVFLALLIVPAMCPGCAGTSNYYTYVTPTPTPSPDPEAVIKWVLATYYSPETVTLMQEDAAPIVGHYGGLNVFTTAQYGRRFIVGTVDLKDVFDARIPANHEVFKKYARDNFLITNPAPSQIYYMYSLASTRFMRELAYDGVLFRPDEFHPVFTKSTDTWLYLREEPDGVHGQHPAPNVTIYYSARIDDRRPEVEGGLRMSGINSSSLWMYYIPVPETGSSAEKYVPYEPVERETQHGSTSPEILNEYVPPVATAEIMARRQALGIVSSPLSNRDDLPVGGWKNQDYSDSIWRIGFSFSPSDTQLTWSGNGHYIVPLDPAYWREPQSEY
jgi:hypothetical protein